MNVTIRLEDEQKPKDIDVDYTIIIKESIVENTQMRAMAHEAVDSFFDALPKPSDVKKMYGDALLTMTTKPPDALNNHMERPMEYMLQFPSKFEANRTLEFLQTCISKYSVATITDLYAYRGEISEREDSMYGWSDLTGADIVNDGCGYALLLPSIQNIKGEK